MPLGQTFDIPLKLLRRYRLKSQPDFVLAPEVVPVTIVDDISDFPSAERRECMGRVRVTSAVAEFSMAVIVNTLPQRIIVTDLWWSTDDNSAVGIRRPTAAITGLTASSDKAFTDFRLPGQPTTVLGGKTDPALTAGRLMYGTQPLANTPVHVQGNWELFGGPVGEVGPGGAGSRTLVVECGSTGVGMRVAFRWIEGVPDT